MKNLAELKRISVGTSVKMLAAHHGGRLVGTTRKVVAVQSNGVWFDPAPETGQLKRSWLSFPKASEFIRTPNGFKVMEGELVILEYEIIPALEAIHRGEAV